MTKPIDCTTSSTPFSNEEIDRKLAEWLKGHKAHVTVIDHREQGDFKHLQMTWQEFFINLDFFAKSLRFFTVIKQDNGPLLIWVQKEKSHESS